LGLAQPVVIDGDSCSVGASVGIAIYPRDGQTIDALVHAADAAMYESKAAGGSCLTFADPARHAGRVPRVDFVARGEAHKTGIGTIDEQHRALAAMVGRVGAEFAAGRDATRLRASLGELVSFARAHFAAEEALMDRFAIAD